MIAKMASRPAFSPDITEQMPSMMPTRTVSAGSAAAPAISTARRTNDLARVRSLAWIARNACMANP